MTSLIINLVQESYVTLQNEKESLYTESSQKIQSLEEARQRDIKNFHSQIEKLSNDVKAAKDVSIKYYYCWGTFNH